MTKKITIKDVAKKANVAISTVSKALNNREGLVNLETQKRILKIAKKMGFTPNAVARSLANKRTENIGFLTRDIVGFKNSPYFTDIFSGVVRQANKNHFNIFFNSIVDDYSSGQWTGHLPKIIVEKNVEGVLLAGYFELEVVEAIADLGIKVVLLDNYFKQNNFDSVLFDNKNGAYKAVEYLIDLGHKNIAFLGGPLDNLTFKNRLNGYKKALKEHNLVFDKGNIIGNITLTLKGFKKVIPQIDKLISKKNAPTAVFCVSDRLAMNFISYVQEKKMSVPKDFSVVGFDDIHDSQYTNPPLTTIKVSREELGRKGVDILIDKITGREKNYVTLKLPYELIVRDSCKKI